jgi:hypothetical protein
VSNIFEDGGDEKPLFWVEVANKNSSNYFFSHYNSLPFIANLDHKESWPTLFGIKSTISAKMGSKGGEKDKHFSMIIS